MPGSRKEAVDWETSGYEKGPAREHITEKRTATVSRTFGKNEKGTGVQSNTTGTEGARSEEREVAGGRLVEIEQPLIERGDQRVGLIKTKRIYGLAKQRKRNARQSTQTWEIIQDT